MSKRDIYARNDPSADVSRGSTSKTNQVHRRLRDDIVEGRIRPGTPISERSLADEYDVSRVPVREALIRLERDGLVQTWPGRGAVVTVFSAEMMRSIYHAREALEGMAARLAAERSSNGTLASLRDRLRMELDEEMHDTEVLSRLGEELHGAVIQASRNSVLISMSAAIADRVTICRRLSYNGVAPTDRYADAAQEHLDIANAIDRGDPYAAETAMRRHIGTWMEILGDHMTGDRVPYRSR